MKALTQQEALEQGYVYCTPLDGETALIKIQDCDFKKNYVLIDKQTRPFQITDDVIKDLLNDYLDSQEEVDNESGALNELVNEIDFGEITQKINTSFEVIPYYHSTRIRLLQSTNPQNKES